MALEVLAEVIVCLLSFFTGFQSARLHSHFRGLPILMLSSLSALSYRFLLQSASRLHLCLSVGMYACAYFLGSAMVFIGLTGGIACGKSTVVGIIRKHYPEVLIIDCDKIAKDLRRPGRALYRAYVDLFGREVLTEDGLIDAGKVAAIIFERGEMRRKLDAVAHPAIFREIFWELLQGRLMGYRFIVLDAPLLFETKVLPFFCHPIITVTVSDKNLWLNRLMARDSLSESEAKRRVSSQMSIEAKAKQSHYVLDNSGDSDDLDRAVRKVMAAVVGRLP